MSRFFPSFRDVINESFFDDVTTSFPITKSIYCDHVRIFIFLALIPFFPNQNSARDSRQKNNPTNSRSNVNPITESFACKVEFFCKSFKDVEAM